MSVKATIIEDMKAALKAGEKERLRAIRFLLAQIKNAEIDQGGELDEGDLFALLAREARKCDEAADEFARGGDDERVAREKADAEVIRAYLPPALGEEELKILITAAIEESGAMAMKDMGAVMQLVMPKTKGRADGRVVSELVKEMLGGP